MVAVWSQGVAGHVWSSRGLDAHRAPLAYVSITEPSSRGHRLGANDPGLLT